MPRTKRLPHRRELLNHLPSSTAVDLKLRENLSFKEWCEIGCKLRRAERALQWWIGDWWVFGWDRYGKRKQAVEDWGVVRHFKPARTMHGFVASLPKPPDGGRLRALPTTLK
jgi:hypothetical protein